MKYVVILVLAILIVRIDYFLNMFEKATEKTAPEPVEVDAADIRSDRSTIPFGDDQSLKQTPKKTFLVLLEAFHANPTATIRERALTILKANPTMFSAKLDTELESKVFSWRDLLNNNEPEAVNFMMDLMNILQGENLLMMRRFFSLWMEIDMPNFVAAYSRSKDVNCTIATTFGDNIPEAEKHHELYERETALKLLLTKEKIDPLQKSLATNCLLVLGIEIAKIPPKPATEDQPEAPAEPENTNTGVTP